MTPPPDTGADTDAASERRQDRSARIAVTVFPLIMFGAFLAAFFSPSTFVPLAGYMTPLLAVTMLGMGMTLSIPDFTMIARHPKPVILGVLSQYAVMPLVGWSVANLLPLSPELKVGIILIGCVPGGTTSNVVSYLAKGNTALSVSMTAFSTMLAPIVTPLLTLWLAGTYMRVPAGSMALSIVQIVLLPVGAGLACNVFFHRQVARIQPAMPWVSVVAIAAVVAAVASKSQPLIATAGAAHVRRDRLGECDRLRPGLRRGASLRRLAGRPPHDRYRGGPAERGARFDARPAVPERGGGRSLRGGDLLAHDHRFPAGHVLAPARVPGR